jgi:hypothetical protein
LKILFKWHIVSTNNTPDEEEGRNMSLGDCFILMGVGGGFIILGLAGIIWGRHEEKSYFNALAARPDVREFVSHWPERPQPGAVRVGGWIATAIGVIMLLVGFVLWLIVRSPA